MSFPKILLLIIFSLLIDFSCCSLYFEVEKREKCFIEYFSSNSTLMLKWNVYPNNKVISNEEEFDKSIKNINFLIKQAKNQKILYYYNIKERKSKESFYIENRGDVYICVFYPKNFKNPPKGIEINLKITTDYSYIGAKETELIQKKEVEKTSKLIKNAQDELKKINNAFDDEKKKERKSTFQIVECLNTYKFLTYVQIGIIFFVSLLHLYNFTRYIKSLNLI